MVEKRIHRLRSTFSEVKIDGVIITDMKNIRYLCGFSGSDGVLIVGEREGMFLTDGRYITQASSEVDTFPVREYKDKIGGISEIVSEFGFRRVGVESHHMTIALFESLKNALSESGLIGIKKDLTRLRMVKDDDELISIRKAIEISERALEETIPMISPGVREDEIAARLEFEMKKRGSGPLPFPIIVASGDHGAIVHAMPGPRKIGSGELVIIDFGAEYGGYTSDQTMTFMVGKGGKKERKVFDVVRGALEEGISRLKTKVSARDVDSAVRRFIEKEGYGDFFKHSTGHGVGLDVHEPPYLNSLSEDVFMPGMVITIEPGIYIPDWGGVRLEDMVLITDSGAEVLTTMPKSFKVIE